LLKRKIEWLNCSKIKVMLMIQEILVLWALKNK